MSTVLALVPATPHDAEALCFEAVADAIAASERDLDGAGMSQFRMTLVLSLGVDERSLLARLAEGTPLSVDPVLSAPALRAALAWLDMARDGADLVAGASAAHAASTALAVAERLERIRRSDEWKASRVFRFAVMIACSHDVYSVSQMFRGPTERSHNMACVPSTTKAIGVRAALRVVEEVVRLRAVQREIERAQQPPEEHPPRRRSRRGS